MDRILIFTDSSLFSFQIQFGKIGEKSHLKCKVASLAESVIIRWEKHGHVIKEEQFSKKRGENFAVSDLLVNIADESDFGGFRCIAENDVGLSVKSIELEKRGN